MFDHYPKGYDFHYENYLNIAMIVGVDFLISLCTHGATGRDLKYLERMAAWGKLWGGYLFPTNEPFELQVKNYIGFIGANSLLCVDIELNAIAPETSADLVIIANIIELVHKLTDIWMLCYCSPTSLGAVYMHAWKNHGKVAADAALVVCQKCPLWIADPKSPVTLPAGWSSWQINQYTQNRATNATGVVDVNRANFANVDELKVWWKTMTVPANQMPIYPPITVSALLGTVDNPNISGAANFNADVANMPPDSLIAITVDEHVAGVGLVPRQYAVYLKEVTVTPALPAPLPAVMIMRVHAKDSSGKPSTLNVHAAPLFGSGHIEPHLNDGDLVNIVTGSDSPPQTVGANSYIWVQLANRPGFVALSQASGGNVTFFLIPA